MASRIPSFLSSLTRHITSSSTTQSTKSTPHSLNKKIAEATKVPLNNLQNLNSQTTQKKVMSFDEFKMEMKTFEEYKRGMKEIFPEDTDAMLKRAYDDYCNGMYRTYVRQIMNPSHDPGRIL